MGTARKRAEEKEQGWRCTATKIMAAVFPGLNGVRKGPVSSNVQLRAGEGMQRLERARCYGGRRGHHELLIDGKRAH